MKNSIRKELTEYIKEQLEHDKNLDGWDIFNDDYYLIGYYKCEEWLKKHDLSVF